MTGKEEIKTTEKEDGQQTRKIDDVTSATPNGKEDSYQVLSRALRGVAHDFNNSLSLIQGFSDLLLGSPEILDDKAAVRRYLAQISTAAADATRIVRRLRQFYRPGGDERLEPVDVAGLIEEAIVLTRSKWEVSFLPNGATVVIEKNFDHQSAVYGNPTELKELMVDLISNAVEAMPQGGALSFSSREENGGIILEVADTGVGMAAAVREQCLMPFYTTKEEPHKGMGLAAVRGIITRHQGHIEVHSEPGRGSSFRVHLPAAKREDQPVSNGRQLNPADGLKLLIIDDEAPLLDMMTEFLRKNNHQVETAADGLEGIRKFNSGWFDLIITDLAMPGLDGRGVARHIKKSSPSKPVILLTGVGDMLTPDDKGGSGADEVVSKPVSLAELRRIINRLMIGKK